MSALSIGSSLMAGAQTGLNIWSAQEAMRKNEKAMKHRHQWEVADLRRAGLNPILSARNSGTPGLPGVQANIPEVTRDATNAMVARAQVKQMKAQTRMTNAQADVVENVAQPASQVVGEGVKAVPNMAQEFGQWLGKQSAKAQAYYYKKLKEFKEMRQKQSELSERAKRYKQKRGKPLVIDIPKPTHW